MYLPCDALLYSKEICKSKWKIISCSPCIGDESNFVKTWEAKVAHKPKEKKHNLTHFSPFPKHQKKIERRWKKMKIMMMDESSVYRYSHHETLKLCRCDRNMHFPSAPIYVIQLTMSPHQTSCTRLDHHLLHFIHPFSILVYKSLSSINHYHDDPWIRSSNQMAASSLSSRPSHQYNRMYYFSAHLITMFNHPSRSSANLSTQHRLKASSPSSITSSRWSWALQTFSRTQCPWTAPTRRF